MSNNVNNINARMTYENAQIAFIRANAGVAGFDIRYYKLTQSYLRMEVDAVIGQTAYNFKVQENQAPVTNNEQRLKLQDSFVVNEVSVQLGLPSGATDTSYITQTYPDPLIFLTSADQYNKLYNGGKLIWTVNNDVLIPAWDVARHYLAPQTQTATLPATTSPTINQKDMSTDGYYPMEPNIILVGSKNNQIRLELNEGFTTIDANTRLVLLLRGVLVQNSTSVS